MKLAVLPFFSLLYVIDLVIFIPSVKIVKVSQTASLSDNFFGFDSIAKCNLFSMIFYSEDAGVRPLLITSSFAGALFGSVHCLAWTFSFPSYVEQTMWRTASMAIVGCCAATLYSVFCSLWKYRSMDFEHRRGILDSVILVVRLSGAVLSALAALVYPVARITLLILAIISLRSLPPSALDAVDWVELVPHI